MRSSNLHATIEEELDAALCQLADAREHTEVIKKLVLARKEGAATLALAEWRERQARRRLQLVKARADADQS